LRGNVLSLSLDPFSGIIGYFEKKARKDRETLLSKQEGNEIALFNGTKIPFSTFNNIVFLILLKHTREEFVYKFSFIIRWHSTYPEV
jgi:hypothetical protein